ALLNILDSPLNKAGKIKALYIRTHGRRLLTNPRSPPAPLAARASQALYIRTHKNVLFSINPKTRIPRTIKRFSGLMVQLLQKLSIRATNGPDKLMKVIKGPVTKYLPLQCKRVGFSFAATKRVAIHEFVADLDDSGPVVFVVGAFAHGHIEASWVDEELNVSEYPLSAAYCLSRITNAFEIKWKIV
ncbi:Ribosomal RNA small subunit methyltransferase NEP1, partial [Tetrabaena socialis]